MSSSNSKILLAGDSWTSDWSIFAQSNTLTGAVLRNNDCGDHVPNRNKTAIPVLKILLEYCGFDVIDVSRGGGNNMPPHNLTPPDNVDYVILMHTHPLRGGGMEPSLIKTPKDWLDATTVARHNAYQAWVLESKTKMNSCPVLMVGGYGIVDELIMNQENHNNILHCVHNDVFTFLQKTQKTQSLAPEIYERNDFYYPDWWGRISGNLSLETQNLMAIELEKYNRIYSSYNKLSETITVNSHVNAVGLIAIVDLILEYIEANFE